MKMPQIEAFFWLACKFRIRDFMLNNLKITVSMNVGIYVLFTL